MAPIFFKRKSRGFSLVEVMMAVIIIGILAGFSFIVMGRSTDNAEAAAILSDLDAVRSAMLSYSMRTRTRSSDNLGDFAGKSHTEIYDMIRRDMESQQAGSVQRERIDTLGARVSNGFLEVGFVNLAVSSGVAGALNKKVSPGDPGSQYTGSVSGGNYTVWLRVK
ncbi:MAG: prepilin-type N-terminal cleavage/methylation domain-containing protein [Synergistaceae bacterium]|jgi:prepilin-type N-terminal cleavage/methylation domain-containing protein|nr:prepilin-type N-terminal cleavage/methylation domain-containing protein [Synergistaceae bacterium]